MKHLFTISLCFLALSLSAQVDCSDIFISEYLEGTGNNKAFEFFNPTLDSIDLSAYELQRWSNGEGTVTDATQLFGTLPPLSTWVLVNGQTEDVDLGGGAISPKCDPALQALADQLDNPYPAPTFMNGNDALVLVKNGTTVADIFGKPGENPGVAWTDDSENGFTDVGDGAAWLTSNHTLRRKFDVVHGINVPPVVFDTFLEWDTLPVNTWDGLGSHNCICGDDELYIEGCTSPIACNYDPEATQDDGSCSLICYGCTTPFACNYDPQATQDDGSCIFICYGCTDAVACNYDPSANVDDSSCEYLSCTGCTDTIACNYNLSSTIDDGSCLYPEQYYDCVGVCINDIDSDGVCDEFEIPGCTDESSCNFDVQATGDDGSCEYITCAGCQYAFACNYDSEAAIADNESCEYGTCPGCTDSTACNFNPTVSEDDGSCEFLDECGICGGDGSITLGACDCEGNQFDALGVCGGTCAADTDGNGVCDDAEVGGCMDSTACNYDAAATQDDGSCGVIDGCGVCLGSCPGCSSDFDFGDVGFGVSPDPSLGESFVSGVVGQAYYDIFHILVPTFSSDLDESYPPTLPIDSINLIEVVITDIVTGTMYSPEELGLEFVCNNQGDSPDPCMFMGGLQYCASIEGTPTISGNYSIDLLMLGWLTIFEPFSAEFAFADFSLNIEDDNCLNIDECGVCGGDGIPEGDCDCDGNVLDECGVCGGSGIADGACDCEGNILDATGICGGDCEYDFNSNGVCDDQEVYGCTYPDSPSYDASVTADDGSCVFYIIDNFCPADLDFNGTVGSPDLLLFLSAYGNICG